MLWQFKHFKIGIMVLILLSVASIVQGQVQLPPAVKLQYFSNNGVPLSGGCIFTYQSGTSTPLASYTDYTGSVPNSNPIVLGSDGRPPNDIWLLGQAYRIKLVAPGGVSCSTGTQIWVEDGVNPSSASLLSSNNVWTGTNTFNGTSNFDGPTNFQVGFTSLGPNTLGGGGSISGSWGGSPTFTGGPTFTGTPTFSNGFDATDGVFSGQVFVTETGLPPLVVNSNLEVVNLNANLLEGCDWASPCALGGTAPNIGTFTGLHATTSFQLASGPAFSATQGTDVRILSSAALASGAGHDICTDANGGATTSSCPSSGFTQIATASGAGCTTQGTSFSNCDVTMTWSAAFADTSYIPTCSVKDNNLQASGGDGSTGDVPNAPIRSFSTTQITVALTTIAARAISGGTTAIVYCTGVHP